MTDRCNLRCAYCMPAAGVDWKPPKVLLSLAEIARVAQVAAGLGMRRVRLTGGEALVRAISQIDGIEEISLTTNGMLLERLADLLADPLAEAGLNRVNVSLDTLDPANVQRMDRLCPRLGGLYGDTPRGRQDVPECRVIPGRRASSPSPRTRAPPVSVNGEGH